MEYRKYRTGSFDSQLFSGVLNGYDTSTQSYEDHTPSECTKLYNTDFVSNHRNLFLITKHTSNTTHNNTLLDIIHVSGKETSSSSWMCDYDQAGTGQVYSPSPPICNPSTLTSNVTGGLPWRVKLTTGEEGEISGCKSERTVEKCKVQFSLGIMIVVICCNLVKACSMVMAVVRSREPTLVTLGDAVDSFLRTPDPTTMEICFADRRFIKREWRRGWRAGPRQWKQKEVQRWWTNVSKTRWITCNLFCLTTIIVAGDLLRLGVNNDGIYWSTDLKSMYHTPSPRTPRVRNTNVEIKKVDKGVWQSKQCLPSQHTHQKHHPGNPPSEPSTNHPLIPIPNLQLPLHLHALGLRMVPFRSPPPHPPRHIPASRPALHILVTNPLRLRYSSNDPQWPPPLADLAIHISC